MDVDYTPEQKALQKELRAFVDAHIRDEADGWDAAQAIPRAVFEQLGSEGLLATHVPETFGSRSLGAIEQGILLEELGRGSVSLVSDLTVHAMCSEAALRFAAEEVRAELLPQMVKGEKLGAFALTEPNIGSDARNIETTATPADGGVRLNGRKKWISFAQMADVFLVVAQCEGQPTAYLVPRKAEGVSVTPIRDMLGFRAAMIGELSFEDVWVPTTHQVGRVGGGFTHVAGSCLDLGRYFVGWACIGLGQACLEASLHYAQNRRQFGRPIRDHQLVLEMLANMVTQLKAARALAWRAGSLKAKGDPRSVMEISTAKYFTSRMVSQVANDAVQIHGAHGCGPEFPVQRYFRDARITEIIEGSNQMQQIMIAKQAYLEYRRALKSFAPRA